MSALDPRLHAFRPDLADVRLSGQVSADRFVSPSPAHVVERATIVRRAPDTTLARETEYLLGEPVHVFERANGWAWVQSELDHYVGYVPEQAISRSAPAPTHRVTAISSPVHPAPTLKTLPHAPLGYGDRVTVHETADKWSRIGDDAWLYSAHLTALDAALPETLDPVETALRLLEVPYLWGGRNAFGVDCSSLIQFALEACGIPCPRDSDQQQRVLGSPLESVTDLKRNDLVFWPGHVGMMVDATRIVHANATDMAVRIWRLAPLVDHIQKIEGSDVSALRRLPLSETPS